MRLVRALALSVSCLLADGVDPIDVKISARDLAAKEVTRAPDAPQLKLGRIIALIGVREAIT